MKLMIEILYAFYILRLFIAVFDLFILANAITIVVRDNTIAWIFWSAFLIEMMLKIYTYGPKRYLSYALNL